MKIKIYLLSALLVSCFTLQANPQIRELINNSGNTKDYPGKNQISLFDSTVVDVQESGLSYVNIHKLVKIFTSSGAKKNAVITFGYDPLSAFVEIKQVNIKNSSNIRIF